MIEASPQKQKYRPPQSTKGISFVHVGLSKCMSTSLQNIWPLSENYDYFGGHQFSHMVDETIQLNQDHAAATILQAQLTFDGSNTKPFSVFSSEGFSSLWYEGNPNKHCLWEIKQKTLPRLLARFSDRVLVVVRDPVEWIYSSYSQVVKEGSGIGLNDYLDKYSAVIRSVLNLKNLSENWRGANFDVVVLPLELARNNPEQFWSLYESRLGVERPSGTDEMPQRNVTDQRFLRLNRQLNRLMDALEEAAFEPTADRAGVDMQGVQEAIDFCRTWCTRRALEYGTPDQIRKIASLLGASAGQTPIRKESFVVSEQLHQELTENFVNHLRTANGWEDLGALCDSYQDSLNSKITSIKQKIA